MVAAGGGGGAGTCYSDKPGPGAAGGGLTGYNTVGYLNKTSYGGSQTSGGTGYLYGTGNGSRSVDGGFGYGGAGGYWPWGGGGAGYYGGGSGGGGQGGGTSGSSYISGHAGCVAVSDNSTTEPRDVKSGCSTITDDNRLECSKHSSGLSFTDTEMIDGTGYNWTTEKGSYVGQPQPDGSTAAGHSNDGYARITYLG